MMQFLPKQTNTQIINIIFAFFLLTGFQAAAQCTAPGDQQAYGQGQWIGYVYSNGSSFSAPPASVSAFTYRGYTTQTENFDLNLGSGAISGANICGTYADYFTTRFKMNKNYTPGYYTITVAGDDGFRFSTDGGATWNSALSDWATHGYNTRSATVLLSGSTNLVFEYFEYGGSARVTFGITALPCASTAPTAVTGTMALDCNNRTTTLTASGGTAGYLSAFEWGTGAVAGQNTISGQTSASITVTPSATTTYWVRRANGSPCGGYSDAIYKTVTVNGAPGDPSVFGNGVWNVYGYNGANLDVSAIVYNGFYTQNTLGFDSTLAWGSDYSPSAATNWQGCSLPNDQFTFVQKRKGFPCGRYTVTMTRWDDDAVMYINGTQVWAKNSWSGGLVNEIVGTYDLDANSTIEVRVRESYGGANGTMTLTPNTAPTGISGVTSLGCAVRSTTLTATGGYAAGSTVYQWGTGSTVGQNVIDGQTGASITVSPIATTTYWVRLANINNCGTYYSTAATTTVNVNVPPGTPSVFPGNQWNAYAYTGTSLTLSDAVYYGYYTQNTLGVSTITGTNSWAKELSPSSAAGYQGCTVPNDGFVFVYKRQGFPCGMYQINFTFWDDDAELYIDGARVWSKGAWSGETAVNDNAGSFRLGENTTVELRVREVGGVSQVNMILSLTTTLNVASTSISGPSATQCGAAATLTAIGGTLGTGSAYQWGTGTVAGSNIIANATTASISVSPQTTTTYWSRIKTACNTFTTPVTFTVTANVTVAGTLASNGTTVCKNSVPAHGITLSGYNGNIIKWQSATDANFTQNVTDIANTAAVLTPAQIGALSANKYFRAVVQYTGCTQNTTTPLLYTVPAPVVWNGSWSSTPSITTAVEIQSDLTLSTDLTVCSCQVKNTAKLTVNADVNLTVKGKVTVDPTATMIVQNNGSLVQIDDNIANQGNVQVYRNSSKIKRLDYTIWSSPVDNQQLLAFSPLTVTTRFYDYRTANDNYGTVSPENNFETGKGYLIRTPNNHPAVATPYEGVFTGTPHNGTINRALVYGQGGSYNGVGNPYASPIRISDFIDANSATIEGTIWAWRKSNDYTQSSYSVITKFGYVANAAPGGENTYAIDPHGVINTGQGFIVKAKAAGNLVFTNAMRSGNSNNQFFRQAQPDASKFRLNLTDANGSYSQAMVGYTADATEDYDNGMDGRSLVDNNINIYSIQGENKLTIQARPEFTATDVVPMGLKANAAGTYTFTLADTEGLFTGNQAVYLVDNVEGIATNLKSHPYTFTTEAGTFNERFKIAYSTTTLDTESPELTQNSVIIYGTEGQLNVTSGEPIKSVAAYDILGRELLNKANVSATKFSGSITASQQVIVVKVVLENGKSVEKKVILK